MFAGIVSLSVRNTILGIPKCDFIIDSCVCMSYNRTINELQGKDIFVFGFSCTDATKCGLYFGGIWDLPRASILCVVTSDNVLKQF